MIWTDYTRLLLHPRVSRPQMALALYPDSESGVQVQVTSTTIDLKLGGNTESIGFVGKSVADVAAAINRSSIPIKASALSSDQNLSSDDLIGPTSYKTIPSEFSVYDRITGNGIVLRTTGYSISYRRLSRIELLPPHTESPGLPWRPRIAIGSFSIKGDNKKKFHFSIPEYKNQVWSPLYGRPFKDVRGSYVTILEDGAIQVPRYPIFWNNNNILIYSDNSPLAPSIIEDVDVYNGLIYVKKGSLLTENITVDYTYLERNYEYTYLNVNGHFQQNPSILNKFIVFYLLPIESSVSAYRKRTVYHNIGDTLEEAIDSIRPEDPNVPFVVIGAYNIQQVSPAFRTTVLDTRVLGGGLASPEGVVSPVHNIPPVPAVDVPPDQEPIEATYRDSVSYFDIGHYDGDPYPGAASVVIDIPDDLRLLFSDRAIREQTSKFVAAGVYPLIELTERSGQFVEGVNADISMVDNLDFSITHSGKSGIFWHQLDYDIPSGTVMVPWPSTFDGPTFNIKTGQIIEVSPETGYYQPYLHSAPMTEIEWEERELLSTANPKDPTPVFSEWRKRKLVDTRDVSSGMVTKGYLALESDNTTKQFRNISVFSPVRTDTTGEILTGIVREALSIVKRYEGFLDSNNYVTKRVSDVTLGTTEAAPDYPGIHDIYRGIFSLAAEPEITPVLSGVVSGAETTLLSSLDPDIITKLYDVDVGAFHTTPGSYNLPLYLFLDSLGAYVEYASRIYGSGDVRYHSGWYGFAVATNALSGIQEVPPNTLSRYWINPEYTINPEGPFVTAVSLSVETGYANIDPSNEDHRLTQILPGFMRPFSYAASLDSSHFDSMTGGVQNLPNNPLKYIPGHVYNSVVGLLDPLVKFLLTGEMKDSSSNSVASGWFSPHDRLGEFIGNISRDLYRVTEYLLLGQSYAGGPGTEVGLRAQDVTGLRDTVRTVLDIAAPRVHENLVRGGIVDPETPKLLEVMAMWAAAGNRDDATGGSLFNVDDVHKTYSGIYNSGIRVLMRSLVSPEGDMQQRLTAMGNWEASDAAPPIDIFNALSAGATLDSQYLPYLQVAFNMLTGNYSYTGVYPPDATLSSKYGGKEVEVLEALTTAFKRLKSLFPAVDALYLYRNL
ncbi:MAG: hypothetical protein D6698_08980 [Gammaproteobacteria bacterium]|nr:MAG: hypothetical protein D6698_08980 [Gammaproteobacteria bacterium]